MSDIEHLAARADLAAFLANPVHEHLAGRESVR